MIPEIHTLAELTYTKLYSFIPIYICIFKNKISETCDTKQLS